MLTVAKNCCYLATNGLRDEMAMVHNRLSVLRAERGLSRKALAESIGVNHQTVGYLERGDYSPSLELALKIARFFGVPVEMAFALEPFTPLSQELIRRTGA